MSLKGNLASVNLTEIFQMLSLSGREGTLFIYEGARKRAICFTKEGVSIRNMPLILVIFWFYFVMPIIAGRPLNPFL